MLHIAQIRWLFEDEISSHGMANQFEASFIFILLLAASIYIPRKSSLNYSFPRFTGHISKADKINKHCDTFKLGARESRHICSCYFGLSVLTNIQIAFNQYQQKKQEKKWTKINNLVRELRRKVNAR